jgi:hypothetical protein
MIFATISTIIHLSNHFTLFDMKRFLLIILVLTLLNPCGTLVSAQEKVSGKVKITFISNNGDNGKTYIGKLRKGNYMSLKEALSPASPHASNEVNVNDEKNSMNGYADQVAIVGERQNKNKLKEAARNDLIGNYEAKDKKALKAVQDKKKKANALKSSGKDDAGNYKKYIEGDGSQKRSQLSRYYKIATGRRLRDGNAFKKPAGGVALIILYKIREGNTISTYVNTVEGYLKPGSRYNLKYHGTGAKRQYYLEYASTNK